MIRKTVLVPGGRDVRGTLDVAEGAASDGAVVGCPPHPRRGGSRSDVRLRAVGGALGERGFDCLRIDYGQWDGGRGEHADARRAVEWAAERYDRVGLFGYSFGGAVALLAAAETDDLAGVSALAPPSRLGEGDDLDVVAAVGAIRCPVQVVYGEADETVEWRPVVERAAEGGHGTVGVSDGHDFAGTTDAVADRVAAFLAEHL